MEQAERARAAGDRPDAGRHAAAWGVQVREDDVLDLIRRAEGHEWGRGFLESGAQDAVAATFGVHAFLVDAARAHLQTRV
jgi:hypothetical protein